MSKVSASKPAAGFKLENIKKMEADRLLRREKAKKDKEDKLAEHKINIENGTPGDVDFQRMIRQYREREAPVEQDHHISADMKICICVRKRPISSKEVKRFDHDSVTCSNPFVVIHDCKMKVDGISKYLDNNSFQMDHTFHEENTTEELYSFAVQPLVNFVLDGGRATVFAYVSYDTH